MLLACALLLSAPPDVRLRSGYLDVLVSTGGITRLRADPRGRSAGRADLCRGILPEGWTTTPETRAWESADGAAVRPFDAWHDEPITVPSGGPVSFPDMLQPGHALGQTFRIPAGTQFTTVSVHLPTWHTTTSGATLSLLRGGEVLATRRLPDVPDNSWQSITVPRPQGEGIYTAQLSDPVGQIGWWSSDRDVFAGGEAIRDGKAEDRDRTLQVNARRLVGEGDLQVTLRGPTLRVVAHIAPCGPPPTGPMRWRWRAGWTQAGYDCTPKAGVVFSRFYSDNQRYMPAEQLKRRAQAGLSFDGCRWVQLAGTRDADLRLAAAGLRLDWEMAPHEMALRFDTPVAEAGKSGPLVPRGDKPASVTPRNEGPAFRAEWTLTVRPLGEAPPASFPRFFLPDRALEADLNRFWWERGFTYPGPAGPAAWFESMALVRAWFRGPQRNGEMRQLRDYPIQPDGYVNTWGASVGWPFPASPPYDTRHFDTNARFILGCWRFWLWTGDGAFLRSQTDRLRRAMRYQLDTLHGREGLIITTSKDVTGRHKAIGDNYWDILPFGHLDAYANVVFYASLEAMAQMQRALGEPPLIDYTALRRKAHQRYDATFWDDARGRYIGCVDVNGKRHDYGFTFVNLEALHYGLGDARKARRIYVWMETGRTSTGKADTYSRWVFAPRATTIHNPMWGDSAPASEKRSPTPPWWMFGWTGTPFGDQCQDGGAILYTSFYDLMSRARYLGADNAWQRFGAIMARYRMPDRLCGGPPLYRGEIPQQENPGQVGVDLPFPESGLVPCYLLYGVIGAEATPAGLRVRPNLPAGLSYAGVRGLNWRGLDLDLRATRQQVSVTASRAGRRLWTRRYPLRPDGSALIGTSL